MFRKYFFRLCIICSFLFLYNRLCAQSTIDSPVKVGNLNDNPRDSAKIMGWQPSTSLFFELFGKGFYSVNVDFRKTQTKAVSIGLQFAEDGFWPSLMYYHFGGKRFRFETGGGLSSILTKADGFAAMGVHGVVGYRYQKKKGLLFRVGFTPFIGIPFTNSGSFAFVPLVGISFGYSF